VINLFNKIEEGGLAFYLPDGSKRHFGDKQSALEDQTIVHHYHFFKILSPAVTWDWERLT